MQLHSGWQIEQLAEYRRDEMLRARAEARRWQEAGIQASAWRGARQTLGGALIWAGARIAGMADDLAEPGSAVSPTS